MTRSFSFLRAFIATIFLLSSQIYAADVTSPCKVPKDVSYCMQMMRIGTMLDDDTINHFKVLHEKLEAVQIESCNWKGLEKQMSGNDCVRRLYSFVDEQESNRDMFLQNAIHITGRRCRSLCRIVCNRAPSGDIRRTCKQDCSEIADARESLSRKECLKRCKNKCNDAPRGEPRKTCKSRCDLIIY